ncbi:MAG: acylneuraminate cytidylyltransferase family protein [bacterium]
MPPNSYMSLTSNFKIPRIIALIPARSGSQRVPGKNLKSLAGKPLITWTIEAAIQSAYIDRVIVSTDDQNIAAQALSSGADVPFIRPAKYANHHSTAMETIQHALSKLSSEHKTRHEETHNITNNPYYEYLLYLQPTSPLRTTTHIDASIMLALRKEANAIISVTPLTHPIEWCNTLSDDLSMDNFLNPAHKKRRSQDFPPHYRLNGAIYCCKVSTILKENTLFPSTGSYAYIMPEEDAVDIDTPTDFAIAETLMHRRLRKHSA